MARLLVLGASYGLLPGVRLALTGHHVTFVGKADEIAAMARAPLRLLVPDRRGRAGFDLEAPAPNITLTTPEQADPVAADLVLLAMQEPHYADPAIAALLSRIGQTGRPCLSIMNLPPPPFLARLGIAAEALDGVFSSALAWTRLDPDQLTLACPDAQALRLDPARPGELTVTLPSNFKAAPFARAADQALLETLARDWAGFKHHDLRPPVQLLAQHSIHAPLAKWPMLIAGNCRCLTDQGLRSIGAAVHGDLAASEALYEVVYNLALALGARAADLVPFSAYAKAAHGLTRPSSLARALAGGAIRVERIDLLVLRLLERCGLDPAQLIPIVRAIDARLAANAR
ncbi:MAG: hypothetical protein ABL914_08560 [Novosphingobium sp.]|uniref:ketopantoate reductase family protein n=1 Tax=Novosphingobium sp. TaxID=1874826 RepID=UPI0032B99D9D